MMRESTRKLYDDTKNRQAFFPHSHGVVAQKNCRIASAASTSRLVRPTRPSLKYWTPPGQVWTLQSTLYRTSATGIQISFLRKNHGVNGGL